MRTDSLTASGRWLTRLDEAACFDDADLAGCLERLKTRSAASLRILAGPVLAELSAAANELPFRPAANRAGKPEARVYQEFGYCGAVPATHPVSWLGRWLEGRLRRGLTAMSNPPLALDFAINDIVCQRYEPGDLGITPHRDHIAYTGLITLVVLSGRGRYHTCADRGGTDKREVAAEPGCAILMPGPGFAGRSDRPFHTVSDIQEHRLSVGLRHDGRKARNRLCDYPQSL